MKLYNTLTRTKEEFIPLEEGKVKFYMCGPTVYNYIHIGNARAFIVFDVLRRFLEYKGYDVTYVMNLTDIDDRIIEQALKEKVGVEEITYKYSEAFFNDLEDLNILPATMHPKATQHVEDIINLIKKLIANGYAYVSEGDVLFDVDKFKAYGQLSGKKIDELLAGARIAVDEKKRNPLDFVLWKKQKPGEPAWQSPWGAGRPGWHIECSAMSIKYLGSSFDIHAGGTDLVFPHHENEIAQSECATNKKFVKYWLHNGFLNIDGDKMSKSLGNFKTVREVLNNYSGAAIRMFFLQKHYRNPIDLTYEGLQAATSATTRLKIFYDKVNESLSDFDVNVDLKNKSVLTKEESDFNIRISTLQDELVQSMEDDLNTPVAFSKLFEIVREANKLLSKENISINEKALILKIKNGIDTFNSFFDVFEKSEKMSKSDTLSDVMKILIAVRNELRAQKNWPLADKIRDELKAQKIILEDKGPFTEWRME